MRACMNAGMASRSAECLTQSFRRATAKGRHPPTRPHFHQLPPLPLDCQMQYLSCWLPYPALVKSMAVYYLKLNIRNNDMQLSYIIG